MYLPVKIVKRKTTRHKTQFIKYNLKKTNTNKFTFNKKTKKRLERPTITLDAHKAWIYKAIEDGNDALVNSLKNLDEFEKKF